MSLEGTYDPFFLCQYKDSTGALLQLAAKVRYSDKDRARPDRQDAYRPDQTDQFANPSGGARPVGHVATRRNGRRRLTECPALVERGGEGEKGSVVGKWGRIN